MPASETIGKSRSSALLQAGGFLVWMFVLSWSTLTIGFAVAFVWAVLNFVYRLALDKELMWGKAWAESTLAWNYEFLYWSLGIRSDFPGWMGWMP